MNDFRNLNKDEYGYSGFYLYCRDQDKIKTYPQYEDDLINLSNHMKSTNGKILNLSLPKLTENINVYDFVFINNENNEHDINDDLLTEIDKKGANLMVVSNPSALKFVKKYNTFRVDNNISLITNY